MYVTRARTYPDSIRFRSRRLRPRNSPVPLLQVVFGDCYPTPPLTPSAEPLTLTFKSLKPPVSYTIVVHLTDTIAAVKALLAAQPSGPPVETQRLLLKGKALADAKLLKEYSIKDGDTVNLALKSLPTP